MLLSKEKGLIIGLATMTILCIFFYCYQYQNGLEQGRLEGANYGINYIGYNLCSLNQTFNCGTKVCGCFQIANNTNQTIGVD